MPLASTFLDEESMDGCIRKAVEWCEGLPSYDTTHVQQMELTGTIGVTLKDGVWFWATDLMVVAEHHCTAFLIQPSIDSSSRNVETNGMT
jgi:hypothetical protein